MARTRNELNPKILLDRLPDNYREVLNQAERNVNNAVRELIAGYKEHLDSQAKQLEEGTFPQDFQAKISDLQETFKKGLDQVAESAKNIKDEAEKLKDNTQSSNELKKLAKSLSTEATNLETLIDEARTKVQDVGNLSGKVLGTALRGLI